MNAAKVKDPVCSSRTVMMYADGELDASHAVEVETHLRACTECHDELDTVRAMRASIRRSTSRKAPSGLEERCSARLAEALAASFAAYDAASGGSVGHGSNGFGGHGHEVGAVQAGQFLSSPGGIKQGQRRWAVFAFVAAAACFAFVVVTFRSDGKAVVARGGVASRVDANRAETDALTAMTARASAVANENAGGVDFDALLDQLVAFHANPLPPDAKNPDELTKFDPWVGVPVKRSALTVLRSMGSCEADHSDGCRATSFAGGRIHPVRDARGAAALQYRIQGHRLTVYIFDPHVVRMGATHLRSRMVRQAPIYVGKMRGFSVAAAERSGVGYALASDLDEDKSIQMVASF